MSAPILVLFHRDLRCHDHPGLAAAAAAGAPIVGLYVLDAGAAGAWAPGGASRWWLHHSLATLGAALAERGVPLVLRRGDTVVAVADLASRIGASAVHVSRDYEPWARRVQQRLAEALTEAGVVLHRFPGRLLAEPEAVRSQAGEPYRVFTPFFRALAAGGVRRPIEVPRRLRGYAGALDSLALADFDLLPTRPNWARGFDPVWSPGEAGAHRRLAEFLRDAVAGYAGDRDRPDLEGTSRLSPHLHFGELSPAQVWHAAAAGLGKVGGGDKGRETFLKEVGWREFSYHLLAHWPSLPETPFRPEFAGFPWVDDAVAFNAWRAGQTGVPIVDAGMRQLWQTGWMHNRVRMIVASFLTKNLRVPWQRGEGWFWDCLLDADLASNAASWQWVAGSGADAAPYFRIFNPVTQAARFDPDGAYVRRFVPELARLDPPSIHAPWQADAATLAAAGVALGKTYPVPLVDLAASRADALAAYDAIRLRAGL